MAVIVEDLLTAWPVGRDGAPLGPPRPLSRDLVLDGLVHPSATGA
jgi:hypothetical protein